MRTVWKVKLPKAENVVHVPLDARPLEIGYQFGMLVLWLLVDSEAPLESRCFHVVETGEEIKIPEQEMRYVGTYSFVARNEPYVQHVFERLKSPLQA